MAGYCDNFSMIDGDSSNFSMTDGGDQFYAFPGLKGEDGTTFYPHVSAEGVLSWTNDGGKPNPDPVNIKGTDGKSAYEAAVEAGFTGTESEFNEYLSNIGDLTQEVADQKSAIDDLTALVDRKAGMLRDTASGAIASFVPDSTIPDLLGVSVAVEPVQDLHGYDSPWPAGGGKNLLEVTATTHGIYSVSSDGIITVNGTADGTGLIIGYVTPNGSTSYTLNGCPTGGGDSSYRLDARLVSNPSIPVTNSQDTGNGATFTASEQFYVFMRIPNGVTISNKVFKPMIRLSSVTDSTFAPYSNECPISGWSAVGIEATGVNLFDKDAPGKQTGWAIDPSTMNAYQTSSGNYSLSDYIPIKGGEPYIASGSSRASDVVFFDANKVGIIGYSTFAPRTAPSNARYLRFDYWKEDEATMMVEVGNTASATYHAYTGNTYAISLGQTVYGGTLDAVNGGCQSRFAAVDIGTLNWQYDSVNNRFLTTSLAYVIYQVEAVRRVKMYCTSYNCIYNGEPISDIQNNDMYTSAGGGVYIHDNRFTNPTEFTAAVRGVMLYYPLKNPVELPTTPTEITAISGQTNNVWSDAGDVDVEYAADLKTYIDSKIAAAVAALS